MNKLWQTAGIIYQKQNQHRKGHKPYFFQQKKKKKERIDDYKSQDNIATVLSVPSQEGVFLINIL